MEDRRCRDDASRRDRATADASDRLPIAALCPDQKSARELGSILKRLLPHAPYKAFRTPEDCLRYAASHEIALLFIDQSIYPHLSGLQTLHHKLRQISPHMDIIIICDADKANGAAAIWSIQSRCTDYLCRPLTADRIERALQNMWYHPAPTITK